MATASLLRLTSAAAKKWNPTFTSQLLPHSPRFAPNFLSQSSKLSRNFPPTATSSLLRFTSAAASNWNQTSTSQLPRFTLNFLSESSNLSGNLIPDLTIPISNPKSSIRDEKTSSIEVIAETIEKALNALRKPALFDSGGCMGGEDFSFDSSDSSCSSDTCHSSHYWSNSNPNDPGCGFFIGIIIVALVYYLGKFLAEDTNASVLKLQVGVRATTSSIQKDLNRIAEPADTSRRGGFHYVLKETIKALLRDRDHCISGYSSADVKFRYTNGAERRFRKLSIEERGKIDNLTLVNVNNVERKTESTENQKAVAFSNEYVVITILVAVEGEHKLPIINRSGDLKEALEKLASIPANKLKAVEVIWRPQKEDDTLSEEELRKDYPLLKPL